jgi:mono/diheme cytochrome c family protein
MNVLRTGILMAFVLGLSALAPCLDFARLTTSTAFAQNTPPGRLTKEQSQKLIEIRKSAGDITSLIRKKDYDEAEKAITAVEESITAFIAETGATDDNKIIASVRSMLTQQKQMLEKRAAMNADAGEGGEKPTAISFSKDVAPIINSNCVSCHGADNPRGRLNLSTFAAWKQGGQNGRLLTARSAAQSNLVARISGGQNQMPRGQEALSAAEIKTISDWINQGATFDGTDETKPLRTIVEESMPKLNIARPTGGETVSFSKDIAPFFVAMCVRCHSGPNARSGFSMETFADMIRGDVLIAGNLEESRLFRLTGGLENPRMPQSDARLTRKNYEDLKKWIQEGIKYDGGDPNIKLADLAAANAPKETPFRDLPAAEQQAFRITRAKELWKQSLRNEASVEHTADNFFAIGNVSEARLKEIADQAAAAQKTLDGIFGAPAQPMWPDRLGIIAFKDHFGYSEFNVTVQRRDIPADMYGHSRSSDDRRDAFVVLEDKGLPTSTAQEHSTKFLITRLVTEAYIDRRFPGLPEWVKQGTGVVVAFRDPEAAPYQAAMKQKAASASSLFTSPGDLLRENATGPGGVALSYMMVSVITDSPKGKGFPKFLADLSQSKNLGQSLQANFGVTQDNFAQACWAKIRGQ